MADLVGKPDRTGYRFPIPRPGGSIPDQAKVFGFAAGSQNTLIRAVCCGHDQMALVLDHTDKDNRSSVRRKTDRAGVVCGLDGRATQYRYVVKLGFASVAVETKVVNRIAVRCKRSPNVFALCGAGNEHFSRACGLSNQETAAFGVFSNMSDVSAVRRDRGPLCPTGGC